MSLLSGLLWALFFLLPDLRARAQNTTLLALLPLSGGEGGDAAAGYFPLASSIDSAYRLALEHVNEESGNNLTLSTAVSTGGTAAAAALCSAVGSNDGIVAVVSALDSYSTALVGSLSSEYLHLPMLSIAGTAARAEDHDGEEDGSGNNGSYLLHMQPGIVSHMQAIVRLILDMKLARDAVDGRSEETEQVWLVHTSDTFGTIATAAFNAAAKTISVALPENASTSTSTSTSTSSEEEPRATVEVVGTLVLAASSEAIFDAEMATLVAEEASIVVLLAEGFDGAIVRAVLSQANDAGLTEGVQWYLPGVAAFDHIFDHNSTYRDASLAFDMRGTLGVRSCPPRTGSGSGVADALSQEWARLDPEEYPGAGPTGVTADGVIDPLLAFAYDSIFVAAAAAEVAQATINLVDNANLTGIAIDSCPFPAEGPWGDGDEMRDSMVSVSSTLVGATGPLGMSTAADDDDEVGEEEESYFDQDGRDVETVTFCAVNLKPHATWGARFEVIRTLAGDTLEDEDAEGFQIVSPFQEAQTFPASALTYPPDRPILRGRHLDVVMRRDAPPFVFVEGDGTSVDDFTGITPEFMKKLSEVLGFTYSLRAPPTGSPTPATIEMVRNGSADMTGSWITITAERSEYVSFTYPYYDLGIAFVYKPEVDGGVDLLKAFAPFEPELWLMLLFALLITVFLLWLFEGAKNDQFSRGGWGRRHRTVTRGLSRSVYVTSSLMMSQLTHKPETLEGYLLTLGWLFTSFVLAASYTAELASYLTATKLESTSVSIEGLKSGEIPHSSVALLQGGNTQVLYERDFKQCAGLVDCSIGVQPQPCYSTNECFTMVLNGTALTTLADSATADYELQNDFCGLTYLPEVLYPQHYGLVLPFGSGLTEEFLAATLSLREDGTLSDIEDTYLDPSAVCVPVTNDEEEASNMTVADVSGVFLVLGLFVATAVLSWCCRRSPWAKRVKEQRRRAASGDPEKTVLDSYAKMSRRQQKSFAMQATVALLQQSREIGSVSKTMSSTTAGQDGTDVDGLTSTAAPGGAGAGERNARRPSGFRQEMAEGRPVVGLSGSSHKSAKQRPMSLKAILKRSTRRRRRVGGADAEERNGGSAGDRGRDQLLSVQRQRQQQQQQQQQQREEQEEQRQRRGRGGSGRREMGMDADPMMSMMENTTSWSPSSASPPGTAFPDARGADYVSPLPPPDKGGLAARSAATKWLAKRGGGGGGGGGGGSSSSRASGGATVAGAGDGVGTTQSALTIAGESVAESAGAGAGAGDIEEGAGARSSDGGRLNVPLLVVDTAGAGAGARAGARAAVAEEEEEAAMPVLPSLSVDSLKGAE